MCPAVLLASSRPNGNTRALVEMTLPPNSFDLVDLSALRIGYYSYSNENAGDDFIPLIEKLVACPLWIIATPLYWYTMSAQAKTFLDRISDLLSTRKDLGRQLRGKQLAVLCCGTDPSAPDSFDEPFALSCQYLGMVFAGTHYAQFEGRAPALPDTPQLAVDFGRELLSEST